MNPLRGFGVTPGFYSILEILPSVRRDVIFEDDDCMSGLFDGGSSLVVPARFEEGVDERVRCCWPLREYTRG